MLNFVGVVAYESLKPNEKSKSHPSKVSAAAYRNGRLRECANTKFDLEFKRGFVKVAVIGAVRLRECPLRELRLCIII